MSVFSTPVQQSLQIIYSLHCRLSQADRDRDRGLERARTDPGGADLADAAKNEIRRPLASPSGVDPAVGVEVSGTAVGEVVDRDRLGVFQRVGRWHQEMGLAH